MFCRFSCLYIIAFEFSINTVDCVYGRVLKLFVVVVSIFFIPLQVLTLRCLYVRHSPFGYLF